jgi:hypothetical protein
MSRRVGAFIAMPTAKDSLFADLVFTTFLLAGSAMVLVLALWLAQCLRVGAWTPVNTSAGVYRVGPTRSSRRGARVLLGTIGLLACTVWMLGVMPGTVPMPPPTAVALFAGTVLSLLTMASALTDAPTVTLDRETAQQAEAPQQPARKAA